MYVIDVDQNIANVNWAILSRNLNFELNRNLNMMSAFDEDKDRNLENLGVEVNTQTENQAKLCSRRCNLLWEC